MGKILETEGVTYENGKKLCSKCKCDLESTPIQLFIHIDCDRKYINKYNCGCGNVITIVRAR